MKIRLVVITGIILVSLTLALLAGTELAWRFLIFVVLLVTASWFWSRFAARAVTAQATMPATTCKVGEALEESFIVKNSRRVPMPVVEANELTTIPGYRNDRSFSLPSRSTRSWRAVIPCTRRGSYTAGGLEVTIADPLGLFPVRRRFGEAQEVVIYPATVELPFFQVMPRQQPGLSPRRWMASEAGAGAARVREYSSGDSLRHVHWPTTAHSGRLMVKEFDQERANYTYRSVRLIADMNIDVHHGRGLETTEETAVTILASLARKYLEGGKEVGLAANGDQFYHFEPDHTPRHQEQIYRSLAVMRAQGSLPLSRLLSGEADSFDTGTAVIVVMPAEGQDISLPLRRAVNRGALVAVILIDSSTYGGWSFAATEARKLAGRGLNVYSVRRGDDIAAVLDSRLLSERGHMAGVSAE